MNRTRFLRSLALLGALSTAACGSMDPKASSSDSGTHPTGPLLPWKVGNTWSYLVTEEGVMSNKVTTIGDAELVAGSGPNADKMAFKVMTKKKDGTDQTISWQTTDGDKVIRYREQAFHATTGLLEEEEHWDPHKIHIDGTAEHTKLGATWLEDYMETKLPVGGQPTTHEARDRWTVLSESEMITVPAGTFDAVVLQKVGGTSSKMYWYVRGLGKVKETGGQTEELTSWTVSP
jgi:hypothetical protein